MPRVWPFVRNSTAPLLHKVTRSSLTSPYGSPPGAHNWDAQCGNVPEGGRVGGWRAAALRAATERPPNKAALFALRGWRQDGRCMRGGGGVWFLTEDLCHLPSAALLKHTGCRLKLKRKSQFKCLNKYHTKTVIKSIFLVFFSPSILERTLMEIWPRHDDFLMILCVVASPEPHFVFTCTQSLNNPPSLWCPTPDGNLSRFCWHHIPFWHRMRNYKAQSGRVRCFWLSVSFFFIHWQPAFPRAQFICFTGRRDATLTNHLITQLVTTHRQFEFNRWQHSFNLKIQFSVTCAR